MIVLEISVERYNNTSLDSGNAQYSNGKADKYWVLELKRIERISVYM
jgi:hypothetical protein